MNMPQKYIGCWAMFVENLKINRQMNAKEPRGLDLVGSRFAF
jgi:hypothetical protein